MHFLSQLLHNYLGDRWQSSKPDPDAQAFLESLESALTPILAATGPALVPSLALRAEELVLAWLAARRMEDILRTEGVCRMQKDEKNQEVFKEVHPMVEKAMKARERVRKALLELEAACKATAASGGTGALGDEVSPLLRLGDGVLDDALAFEKRKSKRPSRSGSGACA